MILAMLSQRWVFKVQILISLEIGKRNVELDFRRWLCRRSIHLSTGMLVYKDLMSKLAKYLLFISMSVSWLSSDPEFFMCASVMLPNIRDNNLAKSLAILWGGRSYARNNRSKRNVRFVSFRKTVNFRDYEVVID